MPRKKKNKKSSGTGGNSTQESTATQRVDTIDLLECSLCNEQFDDNKRRARTLSCMHYFCQVCLNQIIKSATPHCPTCRVHISISSAENLPPNFLMDDLISKMKTGLQMSYEGIEEDFTAGPCLKHKKCQLYFTCKTHNVKICRDCTIIEHPPSQCKIISFEDEFKETKNRTISNLETQKLNSEKNIIDLQNIITDTELKMKEQKAEIDKLQKEFKENEQLLKDSKEAIQDFRKNKNKIETIHQELISSHTIDQINHLCKEAECINKGADLKEKTLERNSKCASNIKCVSNSFQVLVDQSPDEFETKVLNEEITVHATAEINGEKRFSQLLVKDNVIHLPALSSCNSSPTNDNTITVSSLLTRYPSCNADIYLTLETKGLTPGKKINQLGTVYVKLNDTDYAKYIRKLFMGTIGPTFRGAIIDGRRANCMYIKNVSKYDSSRCSENPPPQPAKVAVQEGTVYVAPDIDLGFVVYVSRPGGMDYEMFHGINSGSEVGIVIEGLDEVIIESRNYLTGDVIIKDVGIVLKYNNNNNNNPGIAFTSFATMCFNCRIAELESI